MPKFDQAPMPRRPPVGHQYFHFGHRMRTLKSAGDGIASGPWINGPGNSDAIIYDAAGQPVEIMDRITRARRPLTGDERANLPCL